MSEKKETPLMEAIAELKKNIPELTSKMNMSYFSGREEEGAIYKDRISTIQISVGILESLLPKEREVIEQAYADGRKEQASQPVFGIRPKAEYFTDTFKTQDDE